MLYLKLIPLLFSFLTLVAQPIQSPNKVLYGVASYYHSKFVGRRTANGQIYSHNKLTAACNRLPLGTVIMVTNLKNNKVVTVTVNDRLAKNNPRVVDLSLMAAKQLDFVAQGLTKVKVEVITKQKPKEDEKIFEEPLCGEQEGG